MIKKILLILVMVLVTESVNAEDYKTYCPANPYKSNVTISNITGFNWLTQQIAEGVLQSELKKQTKGKFKVQMKSRSSLDLINGKFSSLSIVGKNLNVDGANISKFTSNTLCDYNSVKLNKDSVKFRENMVLDYQMELNTESLNKTIADMSYVNIIKKYTPINDVKMEVRDNRVYFIFEIPTYVTKPIKITMSSGLSVKNGKINLTSLKTSNSSFINIKKLISIIEKTNPIAFTSDIMDNKKSKVSVESVKIVNDIILIKGFVLVPKNI